MAPGFRGRSRLNRLERSSSQLTYSFDATLETRRETANQPAATEQDATPGTAAGISIVGARKAVGVTRALDNVTFHASLGEIHGIVGGNGCGKSTLAKVISGVMPVDSGQVSVLGSTPTTPHEARATGIATVFQEVLVADDCTILENLYLGADHLWSRSIPTQEKYRAAKDLMEALLNAPIDLDTPVGLLPLGIKQWITIGRALLSKPRVLILDESSAALDFDSTERLFAKMRELRDSGSAVIIVTHRIAELVRICDRATVMRDGRNVGVLDKAEITEKNLLKLMTGRSDSHSSAHSSAPQADSREVVMRARRLKVWPGANAIDFELYKGEILGVAGLDGQGQSEFVRILAGVDPAVESTSMMRSISGAFEPVTNLDDAGRYGIAYVSGDRKREGIFANLSIYENMLMPLYRRRARGGKLGFIDWSALNGVFEWEAEKLMIKMGARTNKITSLSGGNQQKVLIARAFALNPNVMVLNDPARGIDVGAKTELYSHLRTFATTGKSVVYMSSEIEEFVGFASRVIVFRNGSIFDQFTGSEIEPARILEAMFGHGKGAHQSQVTQHSKGATKMKIVDFDKEDENARVAQSVKNIKIVDFDRTDASTHRPAPDQSEFQRSRAQSPEHKIKIVDFSTDQQEIQIRQSVGRIKIVDFDKVELDEQLRTEDPERREIKIVDFDGPAAGNSHS